MGDECLGMSVSVSLGLCISQSSDKKHLIKASSSTFWVTLRSLSESVGGDLSGEGEEGK